MEASGIATGPGDVEQIHPKSGGDSIPLAVIRVLEDTLNDAVELRVWRPSAELVAQVRGAKRGDRITATCTNVDAFNGRIRATIDPASLKVA